MTLSSDLTLPASQDRILEEARLKVALARQHMDALSRFGLTTDWLDELTATADRVEALPTYTDQRNELRILTADKDTALAAYAEWGRTLRLRLDLAFGRDSLEYDRFPAQQFRESERNETKAIVLLPTLQRLASRFADRLAVAGQTDADLAAATDIFERLKATNEAQEEYKLNRTAATSDRRQAYARLVEGVRRIERVGQAVYGPDSPNGRLFRNHWSPGGSAGATADTTDTDGSETMPVA